MPVAGFGPHGIDEAASAGDLLKRGVKKAAEHSVLEGLMEVADLPHFVLDVTGFYLLLETSESFASGVARRERFENCFGGKHAALHSEMNAFETLGVEETTGIANDKNTVNGVAGNGVPAAVGQGLCAITDEFAAIENFLDVRVGLPLLKCGVGIELGIGVFKRENQPNRKTIV